jgi:hypothetical protein
MSSAASKTTHTALTPSRFLTVGDVIQADASWAFAQVDSRGRVSVTQRKKVIDLATGRKPTGKTTQFVEVPNFKGPLRAFSFYAGVPFKPFPLKGRNFLVLETNMTGGGSGGGGFMPDTHRYPDGHHVTAVALDSNYKPDTRHPKIEFYQSGSFNCMVLAVNRIGRMEPTFEPFKPL